MVALFAGFGVVVGLLGFIPFTWLDFILLLLLGVGNGYIGIILITWMQTRAPKEMLGRIMSLLMFSSTGLIPVSQAISGAVSKWSLDVLFVTAGTLALLITFWMTLQPSFKTFSESLSLPQVGDGGPRMDSVPSH
jgi:MFS family permease